MRIPFGILSLATILSFKFPPGKSAFVWPQNVKPPRADINPYPRILHGDTVTDNYYLMVYYFKKGADSTRVVNYLKA